MLPSSSVPFPPALLLLCRSQLSTGLLCVSVRGLSLEAGHTPLGIPPPGNILLSLSPCNKVPKLWGQSAGGWSRGCCGAGKVPVCLRDDLRVLLMHQGAASTMKGSLPGTDPGLMESRLSGEQRLN